LARLKKKDIETFACHFDVPFLWEVADLISIKFPFVKANLYMPLSSLFFLQKFTSRKLSHPTAAEQKELN
jgi:hypothetical protein